jgi:hypothetical protein
MKSGALTTSLCLLAALFGTLASCRDDAPPIAEERSRAAERVQPQLEPLLDPLAGGPTTGTIEAPADVGNGLDADDDELLYRAATAIHDDRGIPAKVRRGIQVGVVDGRIIAKGIVPDEATYERVDELLVALAPVQNELEVKEAPPPTQSPSRRGRARR